LESRIRQLGMLMEEMTPDTVFSLGPVPVSSTVVTAWLSMGLLFLFIFILTRNLTLVPRTRRQLLAEMLVGFFNRMLTDVAGRQARKYSWFVGAFFLYILFMNLTWLVPEMKPPTSDISTTLALGVSAVLLVQIIGIREKGTRNYLKHFLKPAPYMLPMNIMEELIRPVSLGLRLYGNMFGEEMIVMILFILMPLLLPVPVQMLGLLMGSVQAYVFALLVSLYVAGIRSEH